MPKVSFNKFGLMYKNNSVAWAYINGFSAIEFVYTKKGRTHYPHVVVWIAGNKDSEFVIPCESMSEALELSGYLFSLASEQIAKE